MKTAHIYMEAVKNIPAEITKQTELSFSVADKIQEVLSSKGWSQKQFAHKMKKTEAEVPYGCPASIISPCAQSHVFPSPWVSIF